MKISSNAKQWSTHIPILLKAVSLTDKNILELGSGPNSTPLLHWICKYKKSKLFTVEENAEWLIWCRRFRTSYHRVIPIDELGSLPKAHWGVVFVDHSIDRRTKDIIRFKDSADYIVIHDTENTEGYGYDKIWEHFKYAYTWKDCRPWTSVVSNFKELGAFTKL